MPEHLIIKSILIFLLLTTITACYYDVEEELYATLECESTDMSYAQDIVPILNANCYECHSSQLNSGNVTLDNYGDLIFYVNNGKLLGAIKHEPGFQPMPKNQSQLLDCEIEKIENWITEGALNN